MTYMESIGSNLQLRHWNDSNTLKEPDRRNIPFSASRGAGSSGVRHLPNSPVILCKFISYFVYVIVNLQ